MKILNVTMHITVQRQVVVPDDYEDVSSDVFVDGVEVILDEGDGEQQLPWELDSAEFTEDTSAYEPDYDDSGPRTGR